MMMQTLGLQFSPAVAFSLFYWLVAFCFVVSPTEFQSAGMTIQGIFDSWLGSESNDFVFYHVRRTAITTIFHGFLPLGYFIGMTFVGGSGLKFFALSEWAMHLGWQVYLYCTTAIFVGCGTIVYYWYMNKWLNHPIAKNLCMYSDSWINLAYEINSEFRSIDKFTSGPSGTSRTIVTNNWIIKTGAYSVTFVHQDHVSVVVKKTEEYQVSPDTMATVQYVKLNVRPLKDQKSFLIRILSTDYTNFKARLRAELVVLPNITVHLSSIELFLEVFRDQVMTNPIYVLNETNLVGKCIGCDQKPVGIKLVKQCADEGDGDCRSCNCRPLWCMECMGRWYASRQDQSNPESWLGGHATCPMCRARFCVLDVSCIQIT